MLRITPLFLQVHKPFKILTPTIYTFLPRRVQQLHGVGVMVSSK